MLNRGNPIFTSQTSHAPLIPSVLGAASGCPPGAAELPLAVVLADMPLDLVQHVCSCRVLVLTEGPRLAAGNDGCMPHPTANSQPQEQHFLSQSFCGMSDPRPWKVARVALDVDAAPAGWCLLT